jgi:hypothetical protein
VPEAGWRFATLKEMQRQIKLGLVVFRDDHTEPPMRKAHLMPIPEEAGMSDNGDDVEPDEGDGDAGLLVMSSLIQKQAQVSVRMLRDIFGGQSPFQNPKDHEVIARLIAYVTGSNDVILDSFGGSGTTAHAVLKQNAEDGGNRRFILVEMDANIAENVTTERVRRVVEGYDNLNGEHVAGLGGGFQFCHLSAEPLFDASGQIRGDVSFAQLAEFVWFKETGTGFAGKADSPLLGIHEGRAIYLLYNGVLKDKSIVGGNVLTGPVFDRLPRFAGRKVIYAAANRMGARAGRENVTFKQTPYALEK